ncbi:MAG: DUF4058 family protein [Planctomycetota bacterium]
MPLLDHFHPPLHGPRRWEGFHHAWATFIAQQLNQETLPPEYFAESEISLGPELQIDVATMEAGTSKADDNGGTAVWAPSKPAISVAVDFARLDTCEVRVYQDLGGAKLRAAIELVSPANKDRPGSRRTFAAKCAGYLKHGVGLCIIDIVTQRAANLHAELCEVLEAEEAQWSALTGLSAIAYRPVTIAQWPHLEIWPQALELGHPLPVVPLWVNLDICVPIRLEDTYRATCQSLRISG